jgi:hypothetical protein
MKMRKLSVNIFRTRLQQIAWIVLTLFLARNMVHGLKERMSMEDVTAFVCGAQVVRDHGNPYLAKPMHACEVARFAEIHKPALGNVTTPSPLPLYAYVPVIPFTYLPEKFTVVAWSAVLLACVTGSCFMLSRLTGYPILLSFLVLFIPDVFLALALGQIVPMILCALLGAIILLKSGKIFSASASALFTMIEPNIGLPVCLALFLIEKRARLPLICGAFVLAGISLLLGPPALHLQYLTQVLPAHAASEVQNDEQLSLTHFAWLLGIGQSLALKIGSLSYAAGLIAGCFAAIRLHAQSRLKDLALLAAPSLALIGGTYAHVQQYSIIIAFGLVLASKLENQERPARLLSTRTAVCLAVALLDLPLIAALTAPDILMYTGMTLLLATFLLRWNLFAAIAASIGVWVADLALYHFRQSHQMTPAQTQALNSLVDQATRHAYFVEDVWTPFINYVNFRILGKGVFLLDAPLILAVGLIVYGLVVVLRSESRHRKIISA